MKLRPFELALVVVFAGLALLALVLLRTYDAPDDPDKIRLAAVGSVEIWGTIPVDGVEKLLEELTEQEDSFSKVSYKYFSPEGFDDRLTNALADGVGPDLILVSHEKLVDQRRRIQPISYETEGYAQRDLRDKYVDGALIYALNDGLYGLPVAVDPLMMYWNRDTLTTAGYLQAPKTWEELVNEQFPNLIKRDFDRTIQHSVVAMGEYANVRNSFGILSALFIQGGSQLVRDNGDKGYLVQLQTTTVTGGGDPLRAAADFYTRFSKPNNTLYSWNRSFSEDRQQFVAEDLSLYFGYGSEAYQLERMNPNLNFDVAEIPQGESSTVRRTYGKVYAISLLQAARNPSGASAVLGVLGNQAVSEKLARYSNMAPAYRASVASGSNDTYGRAIYQSAGVATPWLNPDRTVTDTILDTLTKDINENRRDLSSAAGDALSRLRSAYDEYE